MGIGPGGITSVSFFGVNGISSVDEYTFSSSERTFVNKMSDLSLIKSTDIDSPSFDILESLWLI